MGWLHATGARLLMGWLHATGPGCCWVGSGYTGLGPVDIFVIHFWLLLPEAENAAEGVDGWQWLHRLDPTGHFRFFSA